MRRRFLPVLLVAATLILATGALAHGQESKAQPSTPQALRAREAECEARLQAIYRQRGEVVGKVSPSAEAKAADWQQLETAPSSSS
jgi:predicted outer membrane protein